MFSKAMLQEDWPREGWATARADTLARWAAEARAARAARVRRTLLKVLWRLNYTGWRWHFLFLSREVAFDGLAGMLARARAHDLCGQIGDVQCALSSSMVRAFAARWDWDLADSAMNYATDLCEWRATW